PAPDFTFHVMLKENSRNSQFGKDHRRVEEISHNDIEGPFGVQAPQFLSNRLARKPAHRVWGRCLEISEDVIDAASYARGISLSGSNAHAVGKQILEVPFVVGIRRSVVIGQKRDLVSQCQLPDDIVGTDVAAALDWQNFVSLDPEDFHRIHTVLRPVTKFAKAIAAAVFKTTKVKAASDNRASGRSLMWVIDSKLNP